MRLSFFLLIAALSVNASGLTQGITIVKEKITIKEALNEINKQAGYSFIGGKALIEHTPLISLSLKDATINAAMDQCLKGLPYDYIIRGKIITILPRTTQTSDLQTPDTTHPQTPATTSLTGIIYDEEGDPLAGANILVKGTDKGTSADAEGRFTITTAPGSTLIVSNIGYATFTIRLKKGQDYVAVELIRAENKLAQVQVIAYGSTTRGMMTSPISTVKSTDIRNLPLSSFDQMLQGLASGVFVNTNSGSPGKQPSISIRGRNSINSGDPLYVIDGTPIISGPLGPAGEELDPLVGIDPGDIASVTILKDAGSTAIYGSRAANGVILITTKRGRVGKTVFTVNGLQGAGIPQGRLNLLKTKDYVALRKEAFLNDNPGQPLPDDLQNLDSTTNTNWQDLVYKPTTISEYKINASGGNAITQFYIGGGYRKETNPLSGKKGLDRGTFRLNLDHKEGRRLKISASIGASRDGNQNTHDGGDALGAVFAALSAPPDVKPYDTAGNLTVIPLPSGIVGNPLAIFRVKLDNTTTQLKTGLNINYELFDGFAFHTDLGYDYNDLSAKTYIPKAVNAVLQNPLYDARQFNNQTNTYSIEPQFRLNEAWGKKHVLEAVVGSTFQKSRTTRETLYGKGYASDDLQEISAAATTFGSSLSVNYAFTSLFGRANYIYDSRYILNASFRRDGSSRFGPDNRFGDFWAISGGWLFSRESFFHSWHFLSSGKLRTSYGIVGNDAIGDFTYLDQWTSLPYGGQPGSRPVSAENRNVKWERTGKFDVGLDLGFLHERITVTANYFDNRTNNLLVDKTLPGQTGFTTVTENLPARVKNRGVELELSSVNVRTTDFYWGTKFNITNQKNLLDAFPGLANTSYYNLNYKIGEPLSLLWGYKFLGVDPATGTPLYDGFNVNGSPKNPSDPNPGFQIIGRYAPHYYGGLINNFSWKQFSLDVFFQFVQGIDVRTGHSELNSSSSSVYNQETSVLRRWTKPGDLTQVPRSATSDQAWWVTSTIDDQSSRFISDGTYWRLKNITFSYTLPASLMTRMKIKELRLYVSGQNLATFTHFKGIDPETGGDVAPVRMMVAGINLSF